MFNIVKKVLYYILFVQEKILSYQLDKSLKSSYTNKTVKNIFSATEHLTISAETEKIKSLVRVNVENISKNCSFDPHKLIEYIEKNGTSVFRINNAHKILSPIKEDEGMIFELKGLKALYLNLMLKSKFSFIFEPAFVISENHIDALYTIHQFYKWYSMKSNLPGFDYKSQQNFKKYLNNINDKSLSKLSMEDTLSLAEAVARDQEATDFALYVAQNTEGAKKVKQKISDGGAQI